MKNTFKIFLLLPFLVGCSTIIYSIRGPKYEGKFDIEDLPSVLDTSMFYEGEWKTKMMNNIADVVNYEYIRFRSDGVIEMWSSESNRLSFSVLKSLDLTEEFYVAEKNILKWEIYIDSYNGPMYYKAEVFSDSIVTWQVGNKRASQLTYYKMGS